MLYSMQFMWNREVIFYTCISSFSLYSCIIETCKSLGKFKYVILFNTAWCEVKYFLKILQNIFELCVLHRFYFIFCTN